MTPSSDLAAEWQSAMRAHDFAAAHAISDAVLRARDDTPDDPALPYHLRRVWDGTPPDGRDVLVRCYHGLGDTVQFARFLPALAARANTVRVEAQAALLDVLAPHVPAVSFVAFDPARPVAVPPGGVALEIMETQFALRADAGRAPYLAATPAPGLASATAVCWRSGGWDFARDIAWTALRPHLTGKLVCAQRDAEGGDFVARIGEGNVGALASMLAGVARVVTVDTFVAHLAGALGVPVTVLLRADADWRWGLGPRTPWYPSATLLRQHAPGDWSAPLAALRAAG